MNLQAKKQFQIICLLKCRFKSVYEIGVTEARLWPCIFCRSIKVLRRTITGVTQCGHYASVTQGNLQSNKTFLNNLSVETKYENLFTRSELLSPGCGRAYSVVQSRYYAASSPDLLNAAITLLSHKRTYKTGKHF